MQEKELKTSVGQRVAIGIIAFIMLGSIIASYAAIIVGNSTANSSETSELSEDRIKYYENKYAFKTASEDDFARFSPYLSEVKAYNETSANENSVQRKDLLEGSGRTLSKDDGDYLAYYVGWCADESIFDSSLDNDKNPAAFAKALDVSLGMIEGWYTGVEGMKLGGVREITIPGSLAYKDQTEICGGYNKPLKFLVMAVANEDPLKTAAANVDSSYMMLQYANYGIDYEKEAVSGSNH